MQVAYYDQQREQLDPERTVVDTVGDGNDTVTVNGQPRHVHGYLQDFLFSPERARSPVKALSGGERNRLLLARLFTRPANVLVLDEPTNDLDLETLELLEAQLVEWPGTLLLVSHDRRFLDNVVTSTLVFEGQRQGAGVRRRLRRLAAPTTESDGREGARPGWSPSATRSGSDPSSRPGSRPLRPRSQAHLQGRARIRGAAGAIAALEAEQKTLQADVAHPDFYKKGKDVIKKTLARIEAIDASCSTRPRDGTLDSLQK